MLWVSKRWLSVRLQSKLDVLQHADIADQYLGTEGKSEGWFYDSIETFHPSPT